MKNEHKRVNDVKGKLISKTFTPASATIMFAISNTIYYGVSLIYTPIFSRLLSTSDYGIVTLYNSWSSILLLIGTLSVWSCAYNGFLDYKNELDSFFSSALLLSTTVTTCIFLVSLLFYQQLESFIRLPQPVLIFMFFNILFSPAYHLWMAWQRYRYQWIWLLIVAVGSAITTLFVGLWAVNHFPDQRASAKIIGCGLFPVLVSCGLYLSILVRGKFNIDLNKWKYVLRICIPMLPGTIASGLFSQSDRIIIAKLIGEADAGIYGMAGNISTIAYTIIASAVNVTLVPLLFQRIEKKSFSSISHISEFLTSLVGLGCLLLVLVTPEAIHVLGSEKYELAKWCVPGLVLGVFYQFVTGFWGNLLLFYKRTEYIALTTIFCTFLNIGLNYLLIPKYGICSAAYSTMICSAVMIILNLLFFRIVAKKYGIDCHIYNLHRIGVRVFLITILTFCTMLAFSFIWLRVVLILTILGWMLFKRKYIISSLKELS